MAASNSVAGHGSFQQGLGVGVVVTGDVDNDAMHDAGEAERRPVTRRDGLSDLASDSCAFVGQGEVGGLGADVLGGDGQGVDVQFGGTVRGAGFVAAFDDVAESDVVVSDGNRLAAGEALFVFAEPVVDVMQVPSWIKRA